MLQCTHLLLGGNDTVPRCSVVTRRCTLHPLPSSFHAVYLVDCSVYCCHTAAVAGIAAAVLLVISLLIALVLRKRILIAIALIKESSRFVHF